MNDKEKLLSKELEDDTASSKWHAEGNEDPHGDRYDCRRKDLAMGDFTDDEIANSVMYNFRDIDGIGYVHAAQDRIRWLSRQLTAAQERSVNNCDVSKSSTLGNEPPATTEVSLLPDNDIVSILSNTGNVLHNLGCCTPNEDIASEYGGYGHELWNIAQALTTCLGNHPEIRNELNNTIATKIRNKPCSDNSD